MLRTSLSPTIFSGLPCLIRWMEKDLLNVHAEHHQWNEYCLVFHIWVGASTHNVWKMCRTMWHTIVEPFIFYKLNYSKTYHRWSRFAQPRTFSLRTSSPDCGGELVTIGGSENSGSVKVSGCESETASLELSSLIRSLPTPPWSRKIRKKKILEYSEGHQLLEGRPLTNRVKNFGKLKVCFDKKCVTNTWSSIVGQQVFGSCNEKKQGCRESKQQSKSRIIVCRKKEIPPFCIGNSER